MINIDYLSYSGLQLYDANIKSFIETKVADGDAKSFKYVSLVDRVLKFYTVNPIDANTVPAYEIELPEQDLTHLMALVKNAVKGNIASFGDNGQVVDSGVAIADVATKSEVAEVDAKAEANTADITKMKGQIDALEKGTYDDAEVRGLITENASAIDVIAKDYLKGSDKTELSEDISEAQAKGEEALAKATEVASGLSEEITARENAVSGAVGRITTLEEQIVGLSGAMHFKGVKTSLPADTTGYEDGDVIIVGNKEYVVNAGSFVEFGDVNAQSEAITDLTGRVTEAEADIVQLQTDVDNVELALADKADKSALEEEVAERQSLDARVVTVEGKAHEHSNATVLNGITSEKVAAWDVAKDEAIAEAVAKDTALETALKKYADDEDAKIESRVKTLEDSSSSYALKSEVESVSGRVTTLETDMTQAKADIDAVEARVDAHNATILSHTEAIAGKASQADLNAANLKVASIEADVTEIKNREVQHVAITTEQINGLFANI